MSNFKIIDDPSKASLDEHWVSAKCKHLNALLDYEGRQYQIIEKKEYFFPMLNVLEELS